MAEFCGGSGCTSEQMKAMDDAVNNARVAEKNARENAGIEKTDGY